MNRFHVMGRTAAVRALALLLIAATARADEPRPQPPAGAATNQGDPRSGAPGPLLHEETPLQGEPRSESGGFTMANASESSPPPPPGPTVRGPAPRAETAAPPSPAGPAYKIAPIPPPPPPPVPPAVQHTQQGRTLFKMLDYWWGRIGSIQDDQRWALEVTQRNDALCLRELNWNPPPPSSRPAGLRQPSSGFHAVLRCEKKLQRGERRSAPRPRNAAIVKQIRQQLPGLFRRHGIDALRTRVPEEKGNEITFEVTSDAPDVEILRALKLLRGAAFAKELHSVVESAIGRAAADEGLSVPASRFGEPQVRVVTLPMRIVVDLSRLHDASWTDPPTSRVSLRSEVKDSPTTHYTEHDFWPPRLCGAPNAPVPTLPYYLYVLRSSKTMALLWDLVRTDGITVFHAVEKSDLALTTPVLRGMASSAQGRQHVDQVLREFEQQGLIRRTPGVESCFVTTGEAIKRTYASPSSDREDER